MSKESSRYNRMKESSSQSVPREKYDNLKRKAKKWYDKAENLMIKYEKILSHNNELEYENDRLNSLTDNQPNSDVLNELEAEIQSLKKKLRETKEMYESKIATLERDAMLKDGKIQQLSEAKEDLRERYKDLKADYREQQRWVRGTSNIIPRD